MSTDAPEKTVLKKVELSPEKKRRNWAVLAGLVIFVALVYGITIVKIGAGLAR